MWDVCYFLKAFGRETARLGWGVRQREKVTQRKREKVRSPEESLSIGMFSVIPQEDSHKNVMFTVFPASQEPAVLWLL